jgi:hypothetical protein
MKLFIDFETRSRCDLLKHGVAVYAADPSTEIMCIAWGVDPDNISSWRMGQPQPKELFHAVQQADEIHAHNAAFEKYLWAYVAVKRMGWPAIPAHKWRCTAAKAAYNNRPRSLEKAGLSLKVGDAQKDKDGHNLMLKMCKPDRKGNWIEDDESMNRLVKYCEQDIRSEIVIDSMLEEMPESEQELWQLDRVINERGVPIDVQYCENAASIAEEIRDYCNEEMKQLTKIEGDRHGLSAVNTISQVGKLTNWINENGGDIPSLSKTVLDELFERQPPNVQRAIQLRQMGAPASVKKYVAAQNFTSADGRAREQFLYYGAVTGRWCLTGDHEVLTPAGWVRLDKWGGGKIATWRPDESVAFTPSKVVSFPYSGEMVHLEHKRCDQISTPDHKMPCWKTHSGEFCVKTVNELNNNPFPYTGTLRNMGTALSNDELRVLVMVQADAYYAEDGQIKLKFKKTRKIERCKSLLRRAGVVFYYRQEGDAVTFFITKRHLPMYLRMFKDKTFGWWLLDCDLRVFFEEIEHWDGYRCGPQSIQYCTCNRVNAEIVQAAAHLCGYTAFITTKVRSQEHPNWSDAHCVNIWLNPSNKVRLRTHERKTLEFEGTVYCAETDFGFFLVRRNGKIWVTGNSGRGIQVQNLYRGNASLSEVDAIRTGDLDVLSMISNDPMDVLQRGCRSMVRAEDGKTFIIADYGAIEARVLNWISGCRFGIATFKKFDAKEGPEPYVVMGGRIYGVDPEVVVREDEAGNKTKRQLGKCLAGGTEVLTDCGWVPIERVTTEQRLWDGEEWVQHDGVIHNGFRKTINLDGVLMTPEHQILIGGEWENASRVVCDGDMKLRALGTGLVSLQSLGMCSGLRAGQNHILSCAVVDAGRTQSIPIICTRVDQQGVIAARKMNPENGERRFMGMRILSPVMKHGSDCLTASVRVSTVVKTQRIMGTRIMAVGGSGFTRSGWRGITESGGVAKQLGAENSLRILSHCRGMTIRGKNWTESKTTKDMNPAISDSVPEKKICLTADQSRTCRNESKNWNHVYDIVNAGPRNRFLIKTRSGVMVSHNCGILGLGYGAGATKFVNMAKTMGGVDIDMPLSEKVVRLYRTTHPEVPQMWRDVERAFVLATSGKVTKMRHGLEIGPLNGSVYIQLPSGRRLFYHYPKVSRDSISYHNNNLTRISIWGGFLTENIVQAISRDLLADTMIRCNKAGLVIVGHIHDEVILEADESEANDASNQLVEIMSLVPEWAKGCPVVTKPHISKRLIK